MSAIKKVLIPTDFSIRSLNILLEYVRNSEDQLDITLAHGYESSISIVDMLFNNKTKKLEQLQSTDFQESCKLIENTYQSKINQLKVELIPFASRRYFNNYIDANAFDLLICPNGFQSKNTAKGSFDLVPYISKSKFNKQRVDATPKISLEIQQKERVADLFLSNAK